MSEQPEPNGLPDAASDAGGGQTPRRIRVHNIKSNHFRVIHADGVWGGVTPHAMFHMVFFNERQAIPQELVMEVQGTNLTELRDRRVGKEGFVRELEVEVLMDLSTAQVVRDWLTRNLEQAERQLRGEDQAAQTEGEGTA
jgi:hypothetical protein